MTVGRDLLGHEVQERMHATDRSILYRARRARDGSTVLVKISAPGVAPREAFVRYQRERELVESLGGRVEDVLVGPEFAAIVLADTGGRAVKELVRDGGVPVDSAVAIAVSLARALDAVHAAGFIHRGLDAWNVEFSAATGQVRILDFELATRFRMEGGVVGRVPYLAPEQVGRVNRRVDGRADLYALGVLLCELLTGRIPADAEDAVDLVQHHSAGALSDIVAKLLAPTPEQRYQTAAAVVADLSSGHFSVAASDVSSRFDFPDKLYGRDVEMAALEAAYERAASGRAGVVMVTGYSGIGKTSVVRELRAFVVRRGGFFASAKLDPLAGDGSQPALASALEELVAEIMTDDTEAIAEWRERLCAAVGVSGQALLEVAPSIARLIGPQPALAALEPDAAVARFCQTLRSFVEAVARPEHPLVLFADDLQWADGATLALLRLLAESDGALLIVGAYRDNEVGGTHQLMSTLGEIENVDRVDVRPLGAAAIVEFLSDMFRRPPGDVEVADLADIIVRKTDGNPFFIRQLLAALHGSGHVRYDDGAAARRFVFDLGAIHDAGITDNVADVLTENLERLPVTSQRILSLAAAIGVRFELPVLATVADMPLELVHDELQIAVAEGLVLPLSELEFFDDDVGQSWLMCRRFGFQHDRIHEAAHAQLGRSERERLHVAIGRLLLAKASPVELDETVFDIIQHLNRGTSLIGEQGERAIVADLALRAGRRARAAGAYEVAVASFRCAVRVRDWSEDYGVAFQAHLGLAECLLLSLDFAGALAVMETATAHATATRDYVAIAALKVRLFFHRGEIRTALECCRHAARLAGLDLPVADAALAARVEAALADILRGLDVEALVDLPLMTDPDALALMTLAMNSLSGAYQLEPKLFALLGAIMVSLSLRHGNCAGSARGYVTVALTLHGLGREEEAARLGRLAYELAGKFGDRSVQASVRYVYAAILGPWIEPMDRCLEVLRGAKDVGLEAGTYWQVGYSASFAGSLALWKGLPLADLADDCERDQKLILELGEPGNAAMVAATLGLIQAYRSEDGEGVAPRIPFDEKNHLQRAFVDLAEVERQYMLGDPAQALAIAERWPAVLPGFFSGVVFRFFHCLAATAVWNEGRERMVAESQAAMKRWAERCPENFAAMYLLVEAERARVRGQTGAALDLYDDAIAAAAQHGLVKLEALGNELAGRFWTERRKPDLARVYSVKAAQLYARWGARRKVQLLGREEGELSRRRC